MSFPSFKIIVNGRDITELVGSRKISLSISESTGAEADTISFVIDDADGIISLPPTGAEAQVFGGYRDGIWRDFGIFVIDEVEMSGYPMTISVNGQSQAAKEAVKETRTKAYQPPEMPTYGEIFTDIAKRNSLTLSLPQEVQSKVLEYEAQQDENDMVFAGRLADKLGVSMTVKNKHMVLSRRGYGNSASGQRLSPIIVAKGINVLNYSASLKDSTRYGRVKATYFDRGSVEKKEVQIPSSQEGPDFTIRQTFQSEEEALNAASTKAEDLRRGSGSASFSINGSPMAMAEAFVYVRGIRTGVDGVWRATTVNHDWDASGGYTTSVECEQPGDEEAADDGS